MFRRKAAATDSTRSRGQRVPLRVLSRTRVDARHALYARCRDDIRVSVYAAVQ